MTSFFVRRPVFTLVILALMILAGIFSVTNLPTDLFPKFSLPTVSVIVRYPGASPEDIEKNVVDELEKAFNVLENVDEIKSTSQPGFGVVSVTFKYGTDINQAAIDVRDKLNQVRSKLPQDILEPTVFKFDVTQVPVLIVSAQSTRPGFNTRYWVEEVLNDILKKVDGVGSIQVFGGERKRQINIYVDRRRLEAYGLTFDDIIRLLNAQSVDIPAGEVKLGDRQMIVRIPSTLRSVDDLKEAVVGYLGGRPIHLEEVADVEDGYAERDSYVIAKGGERVIFAVQKQADANTVKVADALKKKLKEIEKIYPVKFTVHVDTSTFIRNSLRNLSRTLVLASIVVILTTVLFLLDWRASLIIALTLPTSLTLSFLYLYLKGSSINMISLTSMAIVVGSVIDAAIVVVENVLHHRLKGEPPKEAAIFAVHEVGGAITAATITNFVVLIPLLFIPGFVGTIFKELGYISIIVYATSLFIALTIAPSLAANQLRLSPKEEPSWFKPLEEAYGRLAVHIVKHRWAYLGVSVAIFLLVASLWRFVKVDFLPSFFEGNITVDVKLERGTSLEKTFSTLKPLYDSVAKLPDVDKAILGVGASESGFGAVFGGTEASYTGEIIIRLKPQKELKSPVNEIINTIDGMVRRIPGVEEYSVSASSHASQLFSGGRSGVSVEIYGEDLKTLDSLAKSIADIMKSVEGVRNVTISRGKGVPEFIVKINREKAYSYGVTPFQVASYMRTALQGTKAFTLKTGGKNLDVVVRLAPEYRTSVEDLLSLNIKTPAGMVPLANFISFDEGSSSIPIERRNRIRYVEISGESEGRPIGEIRKDLLKNLENMNFPQGYHYEFGRTFRSMETNFSQLGMLLILALIIVFLTVSAQFESFRQAFIIFLTSVPFGIAGASLGFLILNRPFTLTAFVGLIAMVGVVVNNAIVLVDYANILRRRGRDKESAIVEASRRRLRPVLMTALTTALGILPLAIIRSEGSKFWEGLGVSLAGGLLFSIFTTLIVVPMAYVFLSPKKYREE